ncbi:MAG: dihydropteroate synthase [Chitinophagaceae bacterium]|nr:dihydropteroate synthase [Chitinophagaceae bacterium]
MHTLNCKGRLLSLDTPVVMGIINVTPDSFYGNSRKNEADAVLLQAEKMLKEGAAILDMGGQSTRPGSERVGAAREAERVIPAIQTILKHFPEAVISIDTYHSAVAKAAVEAGACMVNDISAGEMDEQMLDTVASLKTPYICMHMLGTPDTMQQSPQYNNVTLEVLDFLAGKIKICRSKGIYDVIADPGFGFGKTIQHNFTLLKSLELFKMLEVPVLAGLSRKSTIYKTLGLTANEALNGTTVLNTIALMNGAHILRVHDVKEAVEAVKLFVSYRQAASNV